MGRHRKVTKLNTGTDRDKLKAIWDFQQIAYNEMKGSIQVEKKRFYFDTDGNVYKIIDRTGKPYKAFYENETKTVI